MVSSEPGAIQRFLGCVLFATEPDPLSPVQAHDAPAGRALLSRLGAPSKPLYLLMDRACEGYETRQLALDLGVIPVVRL